MRFHPLAFAVRLLLIQAAAVIALNVLALGCQYQGLAVILLAIATYRRLKRFRGSGDAYGTARASGFADLLKANMLSDEGLVISDCRYLARPTRAEGLRWLLSPLIPSPLACKLFLAAWLGRRWARDIVIRLPSYVHIGTFAPAGAGKGVSAVIPTLKSHRGSVVVTDPKGENYKITGEFRRRAFGHRVIRLDPFAVCGPGGGLNPLDFLPPADAPDLLDACRDLANALVVRAGTEPDPFWNDRAEQVLTGILCFVAATEKNPRMRTLLSVRRIVGSLDAFLATVNIMRIRCGGVLKVLGESLAFSKPGTEEFAGVMGVVQRHTAWMDSQAVAECLSHSSFHPDELRSGRLSVYLVLPPARLVTLAPLLRCWLNAILGTPTRGQASERRPVLLLLDEAAHLGRMQILEDAITLMRGYGIRLWFCFQSVGQVQQLYGDKAQVVLDNLGTQQYFGTNSYESAEAVSRRIGEMTIATCSENASESNSHSTGVGGRDPGSGNRSTSFAVTTSEIARRWIKPEEVLTMPADFALLMHKNMSVIPTGLVRHYASPLFRWGRTGRNRGLGVGGTAAAAVFLSARLLAAVVAELPDPSLPPGPAAVAVHRRLPNRPAYYPMPIR